MNVFKTSSTKVASKCFCMWERDKPTRKPTFFVDCIDSDQPDHAAQANPDSKAFLFQESLLFTSIPLRRNVSARISLRGLRRLIWFDT